MAIRVGCGSYSDSAYRGILYPRGLPPGDRLRAYAGIFDHIEINSTFYGAPKPEAVQQWITATPPGFLFDIKLHRVISQSPAKVLPGGRDDFLAYTLGRLQPLIGAGKLGVFLLLLPARYSPGKHSLEELDGLVERLKPHTLAVEIRDPAWIKGKLREKTLAHFRERGIAWVAVDMPTKADLMPAIDEVTLPGLAYLRLHGRNREGYLSGKTAAEQHEYLYEKPELRQIVKRIQTLAAGSREVRVVANNHALDFAPRTALELRRMLGQPIPPLPTDGGGDERNSKRKAAETPRKKPLRSKPKLQPSRQSPKSRPSRRG